MINDCALRLFFFLSAPLLSKFLVFTLYSEAKMDQCGEEIFFFFHPLPKEEVFILIPVNLGELDKCLYRETCKVLWGFSSGSMSSSGGAERRRH